jgi:hypothetical protein
MMKKYIASFLLSLFSLFSIAEEGMIIPTLLSAFESDMQAMGMKLSASDIYDANNASIKDAIIHFGGGCTAEIVSNKGLLLTNHHCGFSQIYSHSTLENNIAKYGFWAKNYSEELKNPGLTAARMVRIEDVTKAVLQGTEGLSPQEEFNKIQTNIALIKAESLDGTHFEAEIKPFDYGNSYFLLVKETFRDVRLVGTPPKTVGKFGGDTDNWVWPRHTGDFSVFRIYADGENKPADITDSNEPYTPLHFLPVSLKERKKDDFTMVFGFPGSTNQHTISTELDFIINTMRPAQIKMRDLSLSVINNAIRKSEKTEIQYASKQARIANAWKKWMGQIDGLKRGSAVQKKKDFEQRYIKKSDEKSEWKESFNTIVKSLREISETYNKDEFAYRLFIEYTYVGAEVFDRARGIDELLKLNKEGKTEELKEKIESQKKSAAGFYKNYDNQIDREIFKLQTEYYKSIVPEEQLPEILKTTSAEDITAMIYDKSLLVSEEGYLSILDKFEKMAKKKILKDPGYSLFSDLGKVFEAKVLPQLQGYYGMKNQLMKTYVKGKYEMFPDDKHWPNANSTMRITYGKIEGSEPQDGMKYLPHTTLDGVIEKYNTGKADFDLLPRMVELYEAENYGGYDQDGELWICFTGSNHTTGGNSGSPVIDAEGNLIGINFDRSWESTMSDYMFDASRCRNISVDIRYVLWLIDVYGEAPHIVEEMKLIKE